MRNRLLRYPLEKLFKHVILNAEIRDIEALEDKLIFCEIPSHFDFYLYFFQHTVQVLSHLPVSHHEPNLILRLPLKAAMTLLRSRNVQQAAKEGFTISGDSECGQNLQHIFLQAKVDSEEILSYFTGDTLAHMLGSGFRRGLHGIKRSYASLKENISEYLLYETEIFPAKLSLEQFIQDVDILDQDVERLSLHINALKAQLIDLRGTAECT